MTSSALRNGKGELVTVKLSQIPLELRQEFGHKLRSRDGRDPAAAATDWTVATLAIRQDPELTVAAWKAELVLAGKTPPGPTPGFDEEP